jgi:hypothetical protein
MSANAVPYRRDAGRPPGSDIFTPQELAHRLVALDYGNGAAYAGLQMLEGTTPREAITTCAATVNSSDRLDAVLRGEVDATVLQEPVDHDRREEGLPPRIDHVFSRHLGRRSDRERRGVRRVRARRHARGATHQRGQAPVCRLPHRRFPGSPRRREAHPGRFRSRSHPAEGADAPYPRLSALGLGMDGQLGRARGLVRSAHADQQGHRARGACPRSDGVMSP